MLGFWAFEKSEKAVRRDKHATSSKAMAALRSLLQAEDAIVVKTSKAPKVLGKSDMEVKRAALMLFSASQLNHKCFDVRG